MTDSVASAITRTEEVWEGLAERDSRKSSLESTVRGGLAAPTHTSQVCGWAVHAINDSDDGMQHPQ